MNKQDCETTFTGIEFKTFASFISGKNVHKKFNCPVCKKNKPFHAVKNEELTKKAQEFIFKFTDSKAAKPRQEISILDVCSNCGCFYATEIKREDLYE